MHKLYYIYNTQSDTLYIGITSDELSRRLYEHKNSAKSKKTKLYDAINSYGANKFGIELLEEFSTRKEACDAEVSMIKLCNNNGIELYNLTAGGDGGFSVPPEKMDLWKSKLSLARQGRKPALGMKHTEENKALFSKVSREYWDKNRLYNLSDIAECDSFKEAQEFFGISKTHYYRLRKQILANDQD